jgi:hypothetical protein
MAKKPKEKQSDAAQEKAAIAIRESLERAKKDTEEKNRTKGYSDILEYSQKFNNLQEVAGNFPRFPQPATISAQDTIAPYYGTDLENQQLAAMEYIKQLQQEKESPVKIDPQYYEELKKQVPVKTAELMPHYNVTRDTLVMPNPVSYASAMADFSDKSLSENNYRNKQDLAKTLSGNLGNFYRDTIEHEAGHIADKNVQFAPKPPYTIDSPAKSDLGYMGREDHLVTGLGKVQREWYSKTGQRFESPDQFKQFVFGLAKSENPEEAISFFSEEAKRTLRPQIQNAKEVQMYHDKVNALEKDRSWFKGGRPRVPETQLDFLEKSARLIPALVEYRQAYQPTV